MFPGKSPAAYGKLRAGSPVPRTWLNVSNQPLLDGFETVVNHCQPTPHAAASIFNQPMVPSTQSLGPQRGGPLGIPNGLADEANLRQKGGEMVKNYWQILAIYG